MIDPVPHDRRYELDKERPVSAERAKRELGWAPWSNDDAIVDTAQSLLAVRLVERAAA